MCNGTILQTLKKLLSWCLSCLWCCMAQCGARRNPTIYKSWNFFLNWFLTLFDCLGPDQYISSALKSHGSSDVHNELRSSRLFVDDLTVAPSVINQALAVCWLPIDLLRCHCQCQQSTPSNSAQWNQTMYTCKTFIQHSGTCLIFLLSSYSFVRKDKWKSKYRSVE